MTDRWNDEPHGEAGREPGADPVPPPGTAAEPPADPGAEPAPPPGHKKKMALAAVAVLAVGGLAAFLAVELRPEPERRDPETPPPLVRTLTVQPQAVPLDVRSQGTVRPRTQSQLVAQVAGRIVGTAESFADGGFFAAGQTLVRIDPSDYRLAIEDTRAAVAQARTRLEREQAEAEVARQEWEELGTGEPNALVLRRPQLAEARAAVEAAEAQLERARLNLARTTVEAPFAGRVREKMVDVGQYVSPGTPLATVYATDAAEVRLPVEKRQLAFLDVGLGYEAAGGGPPVELSAELGGRTRTWRGRVVRTAGEIDPQTRMLDLFARVDDPFNRNGTPQAAPLPVGLFVEARIAGKTLDGAFVVPRAALRPAARGRGEEVLVVDGEGRVRVRAVEVVRAVGDEAVVAAGLDAGDRVIVSRLEEAVDGMRVRVAEGEAGVGTRAGEPGDRL